MATENTSQVNMFIKGMNTDTSYQMMDSSTYTYAKNLRINSVSTTESNIGHNRGGEIKPIKGITTFYNSGNAIANKILACGSIRDYGVIIFATDNGAYNTISVARFPNKIGRSLHIDDIESQEIQDIFEGDDGFKVIFGPAKYEYDLPNNFSIQFRYEDEDNIKLYMADGNHPIMVLNIAPSNDDYNYNLGLEGGISKIVSYPAISFTPPEFVGTIAGVLKPAKVQYSYRLYNKNGVSTDISPTTKLIPIVDKNGGEYTRKTKGLQQGKTSTQGVRIKIKVPDDSEYLSNILVYRITYEEQGQLSSIEVILDNKVQNLIQGDSEEYIYIDDVGQAALSTLTYEEYNAATGIHIIPRVIESMYDRLFAANIKEIKTSNELNESLKDWDARAFSCGPDQEVRLWRYNSPSAQDTSFQIDDIPDDLSDSLDCYNKYNNINEDYDCDYVNGDQSTGVYDRFDVNGNYGGTGKNISWKFVYRKIAIDTSEYNTNGETMTNVISTNNTPGGTSSQPFEDVIFAVDIDGTPQTINVSDNEILVETYADPMVSMKYPSMKHNELYRYGIVFYDKYGQSSAVKWIADIRTPRMQYPGWEPFIHADNGVEMWAKSIGIVFSIDTSTLPDTVVAYEIVRCNRQISDMSSVTQGVVSRPIRRKSDLQQFPLTPSGMLTMSRISIGGFYNPDPDVPDYAASTTVAKSQYMSDILQFVSPEITYTPDYVKSALYNVNLKLSLLEHVSAYTRAANSAAVPPADGINPSCTGDAVFIHPAVSNLNVTVAGNSGFTWQNPSPLDLPGYINLDPYEVSIPNQFILYAYYNLYVGQDGRSVSYLNPTPTSSPQRIIQFTGKSIDEIYQSLTDMKQDMYSMVKLYYCYSDLYKLNTDPGTVSINTRDIPSFKLKQIKVIDSPQWDEGFSSDMNGNNDYKYKNGVVAIGQEQFVNWVCGGSYDERMFDDEAEKYPNTKNECLFNKADFIWNKYSYHPDVSLIDAGISFQGPGGRCAIFALDRNYEAGDINYYLDDSSPFVGAATELTDIYSLKFGTYLCDMRQQYIIPYNGSDRVSRDFSTYYSYGDFHKIADSSAIVFDGEYYPSAMEYVSMHKFYTNLSKDTGLSTTIAYAIPVYSTINLAYTYGKEISKNYDESGITNVQAEPANVFDKYIQTDPLYLYNTAYSTTPNIKLFQSTYYDNIDEDDEFDYRCRYSQLKLNDERIDNWTKFMSANYIDVDSRYGEITNLRMFHNQLVFWQQKAFGLLSVNERTAIVDNNNLPLILGEGGVLSRYDYIDQTSGMAKDQFCDTQSTEALYWFDDHNQAIKQYTTHHYQSKGNAVVNLNKMHYAQSIMNKASDINHNPKLFYDDKHGEIVANVLGRDIDTSIVYNEPMQAFTGVYTIPYKGVVQFRNGLYVVNNGGTQVDNIIRIGQWDYANSANPKSWDNQIISTELEYVVNKIPTAAKVFDNQEIVTPNLLYDNLKLEHKDDKSNIDFYAYFKDNHTYEWRTDLNSSTTIAPDMTAREGNYRFPISRASNVGYGDRIRGKYMVSTIKCDKPLIDASVSYVITKFRASWI